MQMKLEVIKHNGPPKTEKKKALCGNNFPESYVNTELIDLEVRGRNPKGQE